jgi:Na+/H+ antiporter NhaC
MIIRPSLNVFVPPGRWLLKRFNRNNNMTKRQLSLFLLLLCAWVNPSWAAESAEHYGFVSVLPPIIAIVLALITRQVLPSIFLGLWLGAWALNDFSLSGLGASLLESFQVYVLNSFTDPDKAAIILFSLMVGGMVGIVSANGGMTGVVERISSWVSDVRSACTATAVLGLAIFFDDYANTLIVGNTMRPLTDANRVSREKLAYLVDSTAAPVACVALVTTWIGYEVGLVQDAIQDISGYDQPAYLVYLNSLAYSFYPFLALFFVFLVSWTGRDFGPMLAAEQRARQGGPMSASSAEEQQQAAQEHELTTGKSSGAMNAILPVLVLVGTVMYGLWHTGTASLLADDPNLTEFGLRDVIGAADSYKALMWGSMLGVLTAFTITTARRILSLEATIQAWFGGIKSMLMAMIILLLAWSLSAVTENLGTAQYLVEILPDALAPGLLPALVFILAAATAFATGSSWGTMGILLPLVLPLAWALLGKNDMTSPEHWHIIYSSVAAVLTGAVWGDHCSPISDTTILSSMASDCNHIEHVRTQLPYAMLVGLTTVVVCTIPAGFGVPWWACMAIGAALLSVVLWKFGRQAEA